jgi:hypothetical protein
MFQTKVENKNDTLYAQYTFSVSFTGFKITKQSIYAPQSAMLKFSYLLNLNDKCS